MSIIFWRSQLPLEIENLETVTIEEPTPHPAPQHHQPAPIPWEKSIQSPNYNMCLTQDIGYCIQSSMRYRPSKFAFLTKILIVFVRVESKKLTKLFSGKFQNNSGQKISEHFSLSRWVGGPYRRLGG